MGAYATNMCGDQRKVGAHAGIRYHAYHIRMEN